MKAQVVFVLGAPGAGKGTQCSKIIQHYRYTHLSAGDLLRKERSRTDSEFSPVVDECFRQGKFVPVEITVSLLSKAIEGTMKEDETNFRFLIDGFPPDEDNLQGWINAMDGQSEIKHVLFFDCSTEICINRCLERGRTSGRDDDNQKSLERRILMYLKSTLPIIEQYRRQGKVHTIDASRSINQVFSDVKQIFERQTWS